MTLSPLSRQIKNLKHLKSDLKKQKKKIKALKDTASNIQANSTLQLLSILYKKHITVSTQSRFIHGLDKLCDFNDIELDTESNDYVLQLAHNHIVFTLGSNFITIMNAIEGSAVVFYTYEQFEKEYPEHYVRIAEHLGMKPIWFYSDVVTILTEVRDIIEINAITVSF